MTTAIAPERKLIFKALNGKTKSKKKAFQMKHSARPSTKTLALDLQYAKKYKHYVKGSVGLVDGTVGKRPAQIRCVDCKAVRDVFTSDLFQVTRCLPCLKAHRKED